MTRMNVATKRAHEETVEMGGVAFPGAVAEAVPGKCAEAHR